MKIKILVLLACVVCTSISGQDTVSIRRLDTPVAFDGSPFEEAWRAFDTFPLKMHRPHFANEPSEKSEVFIGYDNEFIWVGARLFTEDASKIFTSTKKRDEMLFGIDAFGIILDTYNDNENALAFYTTPTGLRTDYSISHDAAGGGGGPGFMSELNFSWNTFWDVRTSRDDRGWYVEMRIPFSSLKFKPEDEKAVMGLIITRNIGSNEETDTYPLIDPRYGFMAINKPSLAQTIQFHGARPAKPVYISPYLIGGFTREYQLNEAGTGYDREDQPEYNAGVDIKYNINSNVTLDLTANTDFAQVEADDQQVNLTRYSLFFPEKRMFFQERSNLFTFSLGGHADNLFYSRNIGIADQTPIRIYGGLRLAGRAGKWDIGFLDMQTEKHDTISGENFGVLRLRRQVINPHSYIGAMLTSRVSMDGNQNLAYGLDGIIRVFGDDYLNIKWAQTYDSKTGNKLSALNSSFILLDWEKRSEEGFAYSLNYHYSGSDFKPGSGFIMRNGVQGFSGRALYGWIPGEESKLFNYNISFRGEYASRLGDGKMESMTLEPGFEINTKKGIHLETEIQFQKEGVAFDFNLSDSVKITAGEYAFTAFQMMIATPSSRRISLMGDISAGQFYDGLRFGLQPMVVFNFSSSLNLQTGYEFNAIRFPDRNKNNSLNIHAVNARLQYMLNTKLSASLLVQYVNTMDEFIANFRLRYNPREGNDFYLVFNDFRGLTDKNEIPVAPSFLNRTIMVKYTHTFILDK